MKVSLRVALTLVALALLAACGTDPSARAGDWSASVSPYGEFTLTITDDGMAIEDVAYRLQCGDNWIDDSNFRMGDPYPLDGRELNFGVYLAGQVPLAVWQGKFSADGSSLTGELHLFADSCSSQFEIER